MRYLLILLVLVSCEMPEPTTTKQRWERDKVNFEVIKVDSCEYLVGGSGAHRVMAHKGDCSNHYDNIIEFEIKVQKNGEDFTFITSHTCFEDSCTHEPDIILGSIAIDKKMISSDVELIKNWKRL